MTVNELIDLCEDKEQREGKTIYRGFIGNNYLGFDKHLTSEFNPMHEAFNGYREVYYSQSDLCSVTTCEGDLIISVFDSVSDLEKDYEQALKFYKDN